MCRIALVIMVVHVVAGCPGRAPAEIEPPGGGPTYHAFVRGFLESRCVRCHAPAGAEAPFALVDWASVEPRAAAIVDEVASGRMPPFQPRDGCRDVISSPLVPLGDVRLLERWRDAGFPEGDASDYAGPALVAFDPPAPPDGAPDVIIVAPEAFTPARGPDVTREVAVAGAFLEDTWVTATELLPSAPQIVHHANAFVDVNGAPPDVPAPTSVLAAYAPGYAPIVMPSGSALFVPAGATVKLFVHYSTIFISDDVAVPADLIALRMWTLPAGEAPAMQAFFDAISQSDLLLPAGAARVEVTGERALSRPGAAIAGVVPHMHLLGRAFRADVVHEGGAVSCLVDLPSYDFFHQSLVLFAEPLQVSEGDVHRMTCVFDASARDADVIWGDASTDEMCTHALLRLAPL